MGLSGAMYDGHESLIRAGKTGDRRTILKRRDSSFFVIGLETPDEHLAYLTKSNTFYYQVSGSLRSTVDAFMLFSLH